MASPTLMLIHALAPPTPGGTPIVLHRLLAGLPGIELDVVTDRRLRPAVARGDRRVLPGSYRYFAKWPGPGRRWLPGRAVLAALDVALAVLAGLRAGRWARRDRVRWIMSVPDEGFSVIAGAVAARVARRPHVIFVFDLWEENAYAEVDRWVARRVERRIWRAAAAIVCHAQTLADHYARKHGVAAHAIPTPIDLAAVAHARAARVRRPGEPREVLFGGALYWAQVEALARLARVCSADDDVSLTIVGDERAARAAGVVADRYEQRLSPEEFRARVAAADVAFLGLSFDSPFPDVVATATPARLPEYMASGTPILVHAPAESHVASYARAEDFAEVVDRPDDGALASGLEAVLADGARSKMRADRARQLAVERHDMNRVRARLAAILAGVAS